MLKEFLKEKMAKHGVIGKIWKGDLHPSRKPWWLRAFVAKEAGATNTKAQRKN